MLHGLVLLFLITNCAILVYDINQSHHRGTAAINLPPLSLTHTKEKVRLFSTPLQLSYKRQVHNDIGSNKWSSDDPII